MENYQRETVNVLALLFKKQRFFILNIIDGLFEENQLFNDDKEKNILKAGLKNLLDDLILSCESFDLESYYSANEYLAEKLSSINISFRQYITVFQIFQDSYLNALSNMLDRDDMVKYLKILNAIHHETLYIISDKFFEIKDTAILALAQLVELRDIETSEHLERTSKFAFMLARELNLNYTDARNIYKAGPLHDIGKVGVKDSILLKEGRLTDAEYEEMKRHVIIGAETIEKAFMKKKSGIHFYTAAMDIVRFHHEKFDGSGYPEGLNGRFIPLPARIFAVADAYDAIVSKRSYKEALPHSEAVLRIAADSGKHFDPYIVKAFLNIEEQIKKISNNIKTDKDFCR